MENEQVFVFLMLTMLFGLGAQCILRFSGLPFGTSLTLALGAFLSLWAIRDAERRPRWR